jgi:benzoylformate decarboxylase/acetolactate synthase-1/2/3 large subunit
MLVVMFNNRAYHNDWAHQERIARHRGTDVTRAYIGMEIDRPAPDFAAIARGLGWHAEGPIADPDGVQAAVRRAAEVVSAERRPVLVDVVCQSE